MHVFGLWEEKEVPGGNQLHTERPQPAGDSDLCPSSCDGSSANPFTTVLPD
ncbi:hypothetical protein EXN66_Car017402 [Channa argus]|uniref:Uncharacterized protein n=1 Tax=Channa argus TaxID=215402 RepID=A0A6G1QGZ7_CHAAH|nr:hypothetical protein EXN66_Car017402 [Channa argus]